MMHEIHSSPSRILMVDDQPELLEITQFLLEGEGYDVVGVTDGPTALAQLREALDRGQGFDLILLDWMMPGMGGADICQQVRQDPALQHVSIIVVTAFSGTRERILALEAGADDYVTKPYLPRELLGRMEILLRTRKAEQVLRRRNADLTALYDLSLKLTGELDAPALQRLIVERAVDLLRASRAELYRVTNQDSAGHRGQLELVDRFPARSAAHGRGKGTDLAERVWREVRAYRGRWPVTESHSPATSPWALGVPLRARAEILGVLCVFSDQPLASFDEADERLLSLFANQAVVALENARLFEAAQRKVHELASLFEASRTLSSSLDLSEVLLATMHEATRLLNAEAGSVLMRDEQTDDLVFSVATGAAADVTRGLRVPSGAGIAGRVARDGKPVLISHAPDDPAFYGAIDAKTGLSTQTLLAVPVIAHGKTIGVVEVMNKREGLFTHDELKLLESLASSAAIAIENARLYKHLEDSNKELERSREQLVRSEKLAAMGRLTVSLAHEINNPLQAIHNCLELTTGFPLTEEERQEYLTMAQEEVTRLATTVQRMLEFYRPAPRTRPTNVNEILDRVLALTRKQREKSRVDLQFDFDQEVPQVAAAPDQLAQVFLNLTLNAIEAMAERGGLLRISSNGRDGDVEVSFQDSGPGISAEDMPRIFEPFFTTKRFGTGVGLAVSYGIIESHGGMIAVQSQPGQGTTFTVRLPAVKSEPAADGQTETIA